MWKKNAMNMTAIENKWREYSMKDIRKEEKRITVWIMGIDSNGKWID